MVSPASSPLARIIPPTVCCLPGGWDNMWCPLVIPPHPRRPPYSVVSPWRVGQHVVSPRIVPPPPRRPPFSVVSPRRVGQHVVSPASSPPSASSPPTVWCLLGGWDNMWCPLLSLQCVMSPVVSPVCGLPCCLPSVWCPHVVPP